MTSAIRFGLTIEAIQDWLAIAQIADSNGFDDIWLASDMLYNESFSAITYGVLNTKRLRFLPYANSVFLRHPVLLASGLANIDRLAPGRVGATYCSAGYETSVKLHIPDEDSVQAIREAIEITRHLWTGKHVNYQGKHWSLTDVCLPFKAREGIPIYVATRGSKYKLAGELADGIVTHGKSQKYLKQLDVYIAEGAAILKRDPRQVGRAVVLPFIITNADRIKDEREKLRGMMGAFVGGEFSLDWLNTFDLTVEDVTPLRNYIRSKGFSKGIADLVDDELLDRLIKGFAVVGTTEECIDEVELMRKNGVTCVVPLINHSWFPKVSDVAKFIKQFNHVIIQSYGD
ncbi:MAG: LLM class flavin-dependent oxidoreductase [Candidatus Ranarchaeia archaeon]